MGFQVTPTDARKRSCRSHRIAALCVAAICTAAEVFCETAFAADPPDPDSHLWLGPGVYVAPSYPGASSSRGFAFPYIDAEYAGRFYSNASDVLGAYAFKDAVTEVGAALQYDFARRLAADDERFLHLRDIRDTARFKLFASHTISFVTGDTNVATDIVGHGQGTLAQANLWFTIPFTPRCQLSVGPGLTWADQDYMATFYGITEAQAVRSRLAVYPARAGILNRDLHGIATYDFSSQWSLGASASVAHLGRDALHSPVTQQPSQTTMVAWLTYKISP